MVRSGSDGTGAVKALRYPVLDSLRGLAAVGVVFHHIPAVAGLSAAGLNANFGRMVDLFFVGLQPLHQQQTSPAEEDQQQAAKGKLHRPSHARRSWANRRRQASQMPRLRFSGGRRWP